MIVQIEIYGYDIVTSLKSVAKTTSNKKLSELFSGLATNISSGGALKNYLEKKSETFLVLLCWPSVLTVVRPVRPTAELHVAGVTVHVQNVVRIIRVLIRVREYPRCRCWPGFPIC